MAKQATALPQSTNQQLISAERSSANGEASTMIRQTPSKATELGTMSRKRKGPTPELFVRPSPAQRSPVLFRLERGEQLQEPRLRSSFSQPWKGLPGLGSVLGETIHHGANKGTCDIPNTTVHPTGFVGRRLSAWDSSQRLGAHPGRGPAGTSESAAGLGFLPSYDRPRSITLPQERPYWQTQTPHLPPYGGFPPPPPNFASRHSPPAGHAQSAGPSFERRIPSIATAKLPGIRGDDRQIASTSTDSDHDEARPVSSGLSQQAGETVTPLSGVQYDTFGQPPMHPSLAGVPGSGSGTGSKQQPSFVCKLYTILKDEQIQHMIQWVASGTAFRVSSPTEFSRIVLPTYFKHANWQSFVRQLNIYGFHKVTPAASISPEESAGQVWEFRHPSFRRGEVQLLSRIKRRGSRQQRQLSQITREDSPDSPVENFRVNPVPAVQESKVRAPGDIQGAPTLAVHPATAEGSFGSSGYTDDAGSVAANFLMPALEQRPCLDNHHRSESHRGYPYYTAHDYSGGAPRSGLVAASSPPAGAPAGLHYKQSHRTDMRIEDLSDRIDAIIRHSAYLESELRNVSDQLSTSRMHEKLVQQHCVHALEKLGRICESLHTRQHHKKQQSLQLEQQQQHPPSSGNWDAQALHQEQEFRLRSDLLSAIHHELDMIHSLSEGHHRFKDDPQRKSHLPPQPAL